MKMLKRTPVTEFGLGAARLSRFSREFLPGPRDFLVFRASFCLGRAKRTIAIFNIFHYNVTKNDNVCILIILSFWGNKGGNIRDNRYMGLVMGQT